MIAVLMRAFAAFCVGTVITQLIFLGYFLVSGRLNGDSGVKIIALLNGIDISGNRLQQILRDNEDREQPDFGEILEARRNQGMNMDLRLRSQRKAKADLTEKLAELDVESRAFDTRRQDLFNELDRIREGARESGMEDLQVTIQAMEPAQAKQQLILMWTDKKTDDVVSIFKALPMDKRQDILAEFEDNDENLADILNRLREDEPMTGLIDQAVTN